VRVCAAGLTPGEFSWYPSNHDRNGRQRKWAVPAHEFAGEIAVCGSGVLGYGANDKVFGMNDWYQEGALAEYCLTRPEWIAPKPTNLSHFEAACVPIGALTAWQGLFEHAKLRSNERLLVVGGTGGVGAYAVQLARAAGAHVISTAPTDCLRFARELGAHQVIDYKVVRFDTILLQDIDVVLDTVGGAVLERCRNVLGPRGRIVSTVTTGKEIERSRQDVTSFVVQPDRDQLLEITSRLNNGSLRAFVDRVLPLSELSSAFEGKLKKRRRGKLVADIQSLGAFAASAGR
jgi:NADPH:quinone reductase-like Zn-dependent oxidoreductase